MTKNNKINEKGLLKNLKKKSKKKGEKWRK